MLKQLQEDFSAYLLGRDNNQGKLLKYFDLATSKENAIEIYRNSFLNSLKAALKNNYSQTEKLLGAEYFAKISSAYINKFPESNLELCYYGKELGNFLDNHPTKDYLPYIKEFCDFEYLINALLFSTNISATNIDFAKLTSSELETAEFSLKDNINLFSANLNLKDLWYYSLQEDPSEEFELKNSTENYLLYKSSQDIQILHISETDSFALFKQKSFCFTEICSLNTEPANFLSKYAFLLSIKTQ